MKPHVQSNLRTNLASLPSPSGGLQRSAPVLGRSMPRVGKGSGIFECWCVAVRCCARGRAHSAGAYPPVSSVSELESLGSGSVVLSLTPRLKPGGNLGDFRRTVSTVCPCAKKPLKRLTRISLPQPRAEAAVLMRVLAKPANLRAGWSSSLALT